MGGINGANFVFRGTGGTSRHGWTLPSGSHAGNKALWQSGLGGGGVKNSVSIDIANYNSCNSRSYGINSFGYGGYDYGGYGFGMDYGGCCGHDGGISEKGVGIAFGIGAGLGFLAQLANFFRK